MSGQPSHDAPIRFALWVTMLISLGGCALPLQPLGEPAAGRAELPAECERLAPPISEHAYARMGYQDTACRLISTSPDGSAVAYVTLEAVGRGDPPADVQEVVKLTRGEHMTAEIYRSVLYHIHSMGWSSDGRLAFSDVPIEGGLGNTLIYDQAAGGITHRLRGILRDRSWNPDASAFYLVLPLGIYGPICDYEFTGYDFESDQPFPDVKSDLAPQGGLVVEGAPQWTEGGKALLLGVRRSRWDEAQQDFILGPATILRIRTGGGRPRAEVLHKDPEVDYTLEIDDSGKLEILSQPYERTYCRER